MTERCASAGGARRLAFLLLSAAVVFCLAGCGNDNRDSTTSKDSSAALPESSGRGEESIERFGSEATGGLRTELLTVFHSYLGAVANEDYPAACEHLSRSVKQSLARFAKGGVEHSTCASMLRRFLAPTAAIVAREQARGGITKVRAEDDQAFIVFRAPGAELYQMTMGRDGSRWKVTAIIGSVLVPRIEP